MTSHQTVLWNKICDLCLVPASKSRSGEVTWWWQVYKLHGGTR